MGIFDHTTVIPENGLLRGREGSEVDVDAVTTDETHTETIGANDYHYAGDYPGSDPDTRLDNVLSAASDGETVYLEKATYDSTRTISKSLTLIGTLWADIKGGTHITADWTFSVAKGTLMDAGVSATLTFDDWGWQLTRLENPTIQVNDAGVGNEAMIITHLHFGDVTFASNVASCIVDSCAVTTVTDNGNNTVGDIA